MESITDSIKFLKSRKSYHTRKAKRLDVSAPDAAAHHRNTAAGYEAVIAHLQNPLPSKEVSSTADDLFSLNPLDMQDIPEDLSTELSVTQSDTEDAQILELLRIAGRSLDLNELLIGCFRKFDVKHKRNQLTARVYRLIKRNLVHNVGKGTYALGPSPDQQSESEEESEDSAV